ncbi:MAG: hypothetical protein ACYDCI_03845 [Candidatus Limnocylindrales bacterium]
MDADVLLAHLEALGLPESGRALVLEALTADEAGRATRSGTVNLSGIFPSVKNGFTVGWESKALELGMYWMLERDPDVLAFVDQPGIIAYYHRPAEGEGHGFPVQLNPDALVVRRTGVSYLDVEPEAPLRANMLRTTGYVTEDAARRFHRPGAEAEVAPHGIGYEIWTERDVPPVLVASIAYLAPAAERPALPATVADKIYARTVAEPSVRMSILCTEFGADDVQAAIVQGIVHVNLARDAVDDPDHVPVFPDEATARIYDNRTTPAWTLGGGRPAILKIEAGIRLAFDGQELEIVLVGANVVLLRGDADGRTSRFTREELEAYWRDGTLTLMAEPPDASDAVSAVRDEIRAQRPMTERSLGDALARAEALAAYERTGALPTGTTLRTIRRWQRERREVEVLTGDPLLGLVPMPHPGNRKRKVSARSLEIAEQVITEVYLTPDKHSVAYAHGQFLVACTSEKVKPFSTKTFGKLVKTRSSWAAATARHGRKGAYKVEPPTPIEPDAPPPNGAYPLAVVHLDYTRADLVLVDRSTGEVLGRPGIFRLLDGYTGITLAILVAFDKPSKRTTLRLLRRCVRNVGRSPEFLVVDLGPEHRHIELRAFAARYHMGVAWRPAAKPRYGSPIERGFGRLTTELINGLTGNTQATKQVRTLTPETDPAKRAVWDLESFTRLLEDYLAIAEDEFHPDLRTSPRKAFVAGLTRHGARPTRLIADDDELRFMTMPYATAITRHIDPVEGVVVEGRSYISPSFAEEGVAFTKGEVRVDDDDASYVLVFAAGRWITAHHASTARKRVASEAEAAILTDEIRAAWRRSETERPERLARLGTFHAEARATETDLRAERTAPAAGVPAGALPSPALAAVATADHDLYEDAWTGLIDP